MISRRLAIYSVVIPLVLLIDIHQRPTGISMIVVDRKAIRTRYVGAVYIPSKPNPHPRTETTMTIRSNTWTLNEKP